MLVGEMKLVASMVALLCTTSSSFNPILVQRFTNLGRHRFRGDFSMPSTHRPLDGSSSYYNLDSLLRPRDGYTVDQMSVSDLAYIGDAVYELFTRALYVWPSKKRVNLQNDVVDRVRAEFQSELLKRLRESFFFTPKEQQILQRGRNSVSRNHNRRDPAAYADATALEALVGYLYLVNSERCAELLDRIRLEMMETTS